MRIIIVRVELLEAKFNYLKNKLISLGHSVATVELREGMTHEDLSNDSVIIFANDPLVLIPKECNDFIGWAAKKDVSFVYLNQSKIPNQSLIPNLGGDIQNLQVFA